MALSAVGSIVLLRYLGVTDFGRYVTVIALVGIVTGITDAGLTIAGQREYVTRASEAEQRDFLSLVLGIRLVISPLGVAAALAFSLAAGYDGGQIAGLLVSGAALVAVNVSASLLLPVAAELRFGAVTAADLARQAATTIALVVAVAVGGSFVVLFLPQVVGGAAALAVALAVLSRHRLVWPRLDREEAFALLRVAAPLAASLVLNVLYFRVLVLLMSVLSSERETGLFGASFRVLEAFIGIPVLMVGAAFPILAHAGVSDSTRLSYVVQRLAEAALLAGVGLALVIAIGAEPIMSVLGGREFLDAAPILRIQALTLVPAFLTQVWAFGLVSLRLQRQIVAINAVALGTVLALGMVLIPVAHAGGAAIAAVAGESALALAALMLLARGRPELRPEAGRLPKVLAAAAAGVLVGLIPGLPAVVSAALAGLVFAGVALFAGAVPPELLEALRRRQPSSPS
jgi:O-antigen/teichoic acid export membrane protein